MEAASDLDDLREALLAKDREIAALVARSDNPVVIAQLDIDVEDLAKRSFDDDTELGRLLREWREIEGSILDVLFRRPTS